MRHRRTLLLLTLSATAPLVGALLAPTAAPGQGGDPPPEEEQDQEDEPDLPPGLLGFQAERMRELSEKLEGSWQLIGFRHVTNDLSGVSIFGHATFTDTNYLSLLIHAQNPEPPLFEDDLLVQSGVHHWRVTPDGKLQTATLLAHTNFDGPLLVELAYTPREYDVLFRMEGRVLVLTRIDGSELTFRKLGQSVFPEVAAERLKAARMGRNPFNNPIDGRR
jgi:hypothetical protein